MGRPAGSRESVRRPVLSDASAEVLAAGTELGAFVERLVRREGGIGLVQYQVLGLLDDRSPDELEPGEIARALRLGSGHLTAILDQLERGDLVARRPHGRDGRRRLVGITPGGAKLVRWLRQLTQAVEGRLLAEALTPQEQEALVGLLGRLRAAIAELKLPAARPGGGP
jgi:DNA-binding MarR family transcriptional regulator